MEISAETATRFQNLDVFCGSPSFPVSACFKHREWLCSVAACVSGRVRRTGSDPCAGFNRRLCRLGPSSSHYCTQGGCQVVRTKHLRYNNTTIIQYYYYYLLLQPTIATIAIDKASRRRRREPVLARPNPSSPAPSFYYFLARRRRAAVPDAEPELHTGRRLAAHWLHTGCTLGCRRGQGHGAARTNLGVLRPRHADG
ncbi:hypothetical protein P280DRAFT_304568 [Massarina eburnea CBS 473.64]|uniref:Uncharacterized protein n=1 Tax=Massarina eburnea CBS 473.64 TaxID=1395130 RepID=A0A6A6S0R8_9PLEO|nr:hypothetical protein P280DRAFT_304568 [Massarina eburnea CBS 473.64]